MPAHFAAHDVTVVVWRSDMLKKQRMNAQGGAVAATYIQRARVVVALNPDPVAAGLQSVDPQTVVFGQLTWCLRVVKTIAQADDGAGGVASRSDSSFKACLASDRVARLPRRARIAFRFTKMQVRDAQHTFCRPPKRTRSQSDQRCPRKCNRHPPRQSFAVCPARFAPSCRQPRSFHQAGGGFGHKTFLCGAAMGTRPASSKSGAANGLIRGSRI